MKQWTRASLLALAVVALLPVQSNAQDRLKTMPGYAQAQKMAAALREAPAVKMGTLTQLAWAADAKTFTYMLDGKRWSYDVATKKATETAAPPAATPPGGGRGGVPGPERGRQFEFANSPDGALKAFYRDRNLWLSKVDGSGEKAITTDGSLEKRTKYGTGSWVYGEELDQTTAIWWSPDNRKVAYYRFDESPVPDYFLQMDQAKLQSTIDVEAYPKAGVNNPIVDVYVYDVATGKSTKLDIRNGQAFTNEAVGHYAYNVRWTPTGNELTMNRTNRRQNIMEYTACSPETGKCRAIVREEWPTGWVENSPPQRFLADNNRFLWVSERNGFQNIYLYDLAGKLHATVTNHQFEVGSIVKVDEKSNTLWYTARSSPDNHMKMQLHRVSLTGKGDTRLTDPAFHHTITLSPDNKYFIDIAQTHDKPLVTTLMDGSGKLVAELSKSDMSRFDELKMQRVELFEFKAGDGVTVLHGMLHKPSNFDPSRKYPVLLSVYGGPGSPGARETFTQPDRLTEYGFLVVTLDGRNTSGRGKKFIDQIYLKLGTVEIDDMAAAVKGLYDRPYIDRTKVGIFGTSYGGYASALALLRHPDTFQAASAMSPVTDWRHYDTIYTERYMWIPQENKAGYDAGSAMTYANNLKGRLMLYYGTADNNVHPSNSMQLIAALQAAGKSFEVQVGPDRGHTALNNDRMMEFFIENLISRPTVF